MKKYSYDRESLVQRFDIEREQMMPDVEKELDVIPVVDAMAVSNNQEKRSLLLEQLKKDLKTNYKSVLPVGRDRDSESAHYVAAAKMEVCRRKHVQLIRLQSDMQKKPEDTELVHKYLKELREYIESGLLSRKEAGLYKIQYCDTLFPLAEKEEYPITGEESGFYLACLVDLGRYQEAEDYWEEGSWEQKKEEAYLKMLEMYYERREKQKFYQCLDCLKASDVRLSPEGLKLLRYWTERRG